MEDELEWQQESWSAWKVWCHPVSARDAIDESIIRIMNLDKNLKETGNALEENRLLYEKLSKENALLLARLKEKDDEIAEVRSNLAGVRGELEEAREELAIQKSVDEKLAEFEAELGKIEEMKRKYEKRIAFLEDILRREKSKRVNGSNEDEMALEEMEGDQEISLVPKIDMSVTERIDLADKNHTGKKKSQPEPELGKKAAELQRSYMEKRAHGLPEKFPKPSDTDEWLLDLPDNL